MENVIIFDNEEVPKNNNLRQEVKSELRNFTFFCFTFNLRNKIEVLGNLQRIAAQLVSRGSLLLNTASQYCIFLCSSASPPSVWEA